ncbi:hypothetical protein [Aureimonas psammosilenae]|uniref:hypothetical protein n=1 Tax=Aureimonas psammosilenae TaxID=2495496 RepID=UPI001260DA48|nr:hypothetical protein [Aureimonas psammosilenae]
MLRKDLDSQLFKDRNFTYSGLDRSRSLLPSSDSANINTIVAKLHSDGAWSKRSFLGRLIFVLLAPLGLGAIISIFPGFGTATLLLLAGAIVLIMTSVGAFIILADLFRLRWVKALQRVFVIALTLAIFVPAVRAGDYIHLVLFYPYYKAEIRRSGNPNQQVRFDWGDDAALVSDGAVIRTLVYDPTGSMAKYVGERRSSDIGGLYTDHLFGDFYLETDMSSG